MRRAGTAALVLAALLTTSGCGSSTVTAKSLKKQAETVQSIANEGALLAHGRAEDSTTQTFTREHAHELSKQAMSLRMKLRTARLAPGIEPKARAVAQAAWATAGELATLEHAGADRAGQIESRLEELGKRAEELAS
jgi:hypothetical protein